QAKRADHLILQELQHAHNAVLAGGSQRPALQPPDPDQVSAAGDRLDDVGAAAEAAIDHDLGAAVYGSDDLRQHMHGAAPMIELTAAMVGDVDPIDAVID